MANLTPEAQAERDRCVTLVNSLADVWTDIAAHARKEGAFTTREVWPPPFKKVTLVRPGYERYALQVEDAVRGLRQIADLMRG